MTKLLLILASFFASTTFASDLFKVPFNGITAWTKDAEIVELLKGDRCARATFFALVSNVLAPEAMEMKAALPEDIEVLFLQGTSAETATGEKTYSITAKCRGDAVSYLVDTKIARKRCLAIGKPYHAGGA